MRKNQHGSVGMGILEGNANSRVGERGLTRKSPRWGKKLGGGAAQADKIVAKRSGFAYRGTVVGTGDGSKGGKRGFSMRATTLTWQVNGTLEKKSQKKEIVIRACGKEPRGMRNSNRGLLREQKDPQTRVMKGKDP